MANIKSQKKRNITNAKRAERNRAVRSELKTRVKAARSADSVDSDEVRAAISYGNYFRFFGQLMDSAPECSVCLMGKLLHYVMSNHDSYDFGIMKFGKVRKINE